MITRIVVDVVDKLDIFEPVTGRIYLNFIVDVVDKLDIFEP